MNTNSSAMTLPETGNVGNEKAKTSILNIESLQ
jgi:hypothetical protein